MKGGKNFGVEINIYFLLYIYRNTYFTKHIYQINIFTLLNIFVLYKILYIMYMYMQYM